MAYSDLIKLFLQLSIILLFAVIFRWKLVQIKKPAGFGDFLAGIVLGPTILGAFAPSVFSWLFQSSHSIEIEREAVIQLGMIFFLFSAGLEVNLIYLRQHKKSLILTGSPGIFIPFMIGFFSVLAFPNIWQSTASDKSFLFPFFVATALSISALPIIAKILLDNNSIRKDLGQVILAATAVNDLIGWSLFAIILNSFLSVNLFARNIVLVFGSLAGFAIFIRGTRRWLVQRLLQQKNAKNLVIKIKLRRTLCTCLDFIY